MGDAALSPAMEKAIAARAKKTASRGNF